jgi:hypothetical protein
VELSKETASKNKFEESRGSFRLIFPNGQRPLVKYKLVSKETSVPDIVYDAALLDLSEEGACLQGSLPEHLIYDLGVGSVQLGCNLYIKDNMIKVLSTLRWYKHLDISEIQFGIQFHLTNDIRHNIQRFLIRHQLDTRRLSRKGLSS